MRLCHMTLAVALLAVSGLACADGSGVVQMPAPAPTQSAPKEHPLVQMDLPVRGMSMRQVERKFGTPMEKIPAVGEPPISRWVYSNYTVYFEHQYVIEAVVKRK